MTARQSRLSAILLGLIGLTLASYLVLNALGDNLSYFFSPTEVRAGKAPDSRTFRVGGMVKPGSVKRTAGNLTVRFVVTDYNTEIAVDYSGILPDLFAEGQGVIAQGRLAANGSFQADEVLAKHDENYMPPEVAAALQAGEKARVQKPQSPSP
jgi:cytochrome c-type biogenesis protein CcmE